MKSYRLLIPTAIGIAFAVAACGSAGQPSWTYPPTQPAARVASAQAAQLAAHAGIGDAAGGANAQNIPAPLGSGAAAPNAIIHQDITIVTGDMIGKTEYPAYVPSQLTLPAHSLVLVTITNFDDATPLPKGSEGYAKASGILGDITVQPIDTTNPNGSKGKPYTRTSMNPNDVSHTFTIPALGINVPVTAHARVSFLIRTGDAGTYQFRCFDPCGAGSSGWGTAMATKDYMEGTLTVI